MGTEQQGDADGDDLFKIPFPILLFTVVVVVVVVVVASTVSGEAVVDGGEKFVIVVVDVVEGTSSRGETGTSY